MKTTLLILCLGDSIRMGWAGYMPCEQPNHDGVRWNCRSSTYVVEHWSELPTAKRYDAVVFNCGLWDAKEKTPPDKYVANLDFIVWHLHTDRIYFCTTTPGRALDEYGRTDEVIQNYNKLAITYFLALDKMRTPEVRTPKITIIDLHALCMAHPEWWGGDENVHYTEAGYKAMAEYVKHALTP